MSRILIYFDDDCLSSERKFTIIIFNKLHKTKKFISFKLIKICFCYGRVQLKLYKSGWDEKAEKKLKKKGWKKAKNKDWKIEKLKEKKCIFFSLI